MDYNQQLLESMQKLTASVEKLYKLQDMSGKRHFYWTRFWGGAFMGLGFAFGTSALAAAGVWILSRIGIVPIVGEFVKDIIEFIELNS